MKFKQVLLVFFAFLVLSCSSEFEKIRTSSNPELILKNAEKYYKEEDYFRAQALYEEAIQYYRGQKEAEDIYYKMAYTHYHLGEFILASYYFENFAKTFYNSEKKEEAVFMSAYSNYRLSPSYKLDQSYSVKAIEGMQNFINTYPHSDRVAEANGLIDIMRQKLEQKAYEEGYLYYKIGQYQASLVSFENVLKDFPETARAEEIRFLMLKSSYTYAQKSVYEKRLERYLETVKLYKNFIYKHPESKYLKEAESIYEDSLQQLENLKS